MPAADQKSEYIKKLQVKLEVLKRNLAKEKHDADEIKRNSNELKQLTIQDKEKITILTQNLALAEEVCTNKFLIICIFLIFILIILHLLHLMSNAL